MRAGRPPESNLSKGLTGLPFVEPVRLESRDRLSLPSEVFRRVHWLLELKSGSRCLAVLRDTGRVELLAWNPAGQQIRNRLEELATASVDDSLKQSTAIAIQRKYAQVSFGDGSRLRLPLSVLSHLRIERDDSAVIMVAAYFDRVFLFNRDDEEIEQLSENADLEGLP